MGETTIERGCWEPGTFVINVKTRIGESQLDVKPLSRCNNIHNHYRNIKSDPKVIHLYSFEQINK